MITKPTHGGKRPNSGRKKGIETITISFRVPKSDAEQIKLKVTQFIKSLPS